MNFVSLASTTVIGSRSSHENVPIPLSETSTITANSKLLRPTANCPSRQNTQTHTAKCVAHTNTNTGTHTHARTHCICSTCATRRTHHHLPAREDGVLAHALVRPTPARRLGQPDALVAVHRPLRPSEKQVPGYYSPFGLRRRTHPRTGRSREKQTHNGNNNNNRMKKK